VSGRLWIDFVNTEIAEEGARIDLLERFGDLVRWCAAAQVIGVGEMAAMQDRWAKTPDAREAFQRAIRFRTILRDMAERLASGRPRIPQETLDAINDVLARGGVAHEIVRVPSGFAMRLRRQLTTPTQLLAPIAESAADFLSTGDLTLVAQCQNPQCILFFYDTTKNHARRWCSMAVCGNRAKVAAHYRRSQDRAGRPQP
jgi:predicted RNA-binding Zn ribbon-like protein